MDGKLPMVRRLASLMIDQGQLRELEDAYCRERPDLQPDGALDVSLDQMLPRSQYEALTTYVASQSADHDDCVRTLYGSLTDGLEARYIQRQESAQQARREQQDPVELAEDLGGDLQLAASHRDNGEEAALWLDRFPEMVRKRAGASPTPSGRRFTVDQVAKVLHRAQSDFRATGSYQAESQAAWCQALRERLTDGRPPRVDDSDAELDEGVDQEHGGWADQEHGGWAEQEHGGWPDQAPGELASVDDSDAELDDEGVEQEHGGWAEQAPGKRASVDDSDAELDEAVEQDSEGSIEMPTVRPTGTTSRSTLNRLRAATSSLGDDDSFATLVEVTSGPDDDYDPSSPAVIEAMQRLMDDELLRFGNRPQAHEESAVREELWTHMVMGYRIGRHLLAEGRHRAPSENRWPQHTCSWLVSYVEQAPHDEALAAILNGPEFSAALHYHSFSVAFLQSCDGKKARARAWVSLVEDCGFLVAVAEDDLLCSRAEAEGATTSEPSSIGSHTGGRARYREKT